MCRGMVIARRLLVQENVPGCYHLISRCVRRLHCLADDERRAWVERCVRKHAQKMAIDVLTYAIMKNHMHIIVRNRPDLAAQWSARDVVDRWLNLVPQRDSWGAVLFDLDECMRTKLSQDFEWVEERRRRLSSVSWMMRLVKQKISICMNRKDEVTGHFWDERFLSIQLPDKRAILACMVYVDLNPFRAGECKLPEKGRYIGLKYRLENSLFYGSASSEQVGRDFLGQECVEFTHSQGESGSCWLTPLVGCGEFTASSEGKWVYAAPCWLTEARYLELLDVIAREVRFTKSGRYKQRLEDQVEHVFDRLGVL